LLVIDSRRNAREAKQNDEAHPLLRASTLVVRLAHVCVFINTLSGNTVNSHLKLGIALRKLPRSNGPVYYRSKPDANYFPISANKPPARVS
jgi:hypothetical protein